MRASRKDPKGAGEDAFLLEEVEDRRANPFPANTAEHRQWDEGFCQAWRSHYGKGYGKTYEDFWR